MDELISLTAHPSEKFDDYRILKEDKTILKELALKKAEIASLYVHKEKIENWKRLNDLKNVRPMVWVNEVCWHEMNIDGELTLQTTTIFAKSIETNLRRTLYLWKHMPVDMVIEPVIPCYLEVENTGFGITYDANIAITDKNSDIYSREFKAQINNLEDIEKIKYPQVTYFKEKTDEKLAVMKDIFDGILKVEKKGYPGFWFSPWDNLIGWWSVEKLLSDLILRPKLVHAAMTKLIDVYLYQLEQYENLNLLCLNNCNYRIGSGGLGYSNDLPSKEFNSNNIKAKDIWGSGTAQIFSGVSPQMHDEFALRYEIQWMKKFGLNYYGCCEPLDKKIEILKNIPNLRKISMSPWVNLELGARNIGKDYVFSYKPSPSIFADQNWDKNSVKEKLEKDLRTLKKCNVEIIMKDISTVNHRPQRLWEWASITMEIINRLF